MEPSRPLALITGASSGIGAAFARRLAAGGYDLVLVARGLERLEVVAAELRKSHGVRAVALPADLSQDSGIRQIEERILGADRLDFLVNNAGFGTLGRFFEDDVENQEKMHRLHVIATLRLTHAALKRMVPQAKGSVVNVSSLAAFAQGPSNVSYCATKAWMNSFTEGLRLDLEMIQSPVKVQALCPGFTRTGFHDAMGVDRSIAPARWWMSPEDVVSASLRGFERNQLFVVPGWRYKFLRLVLGVLPRRARHAVARRSAEDWRRRMGRQG